ncbi:MAG: hypothetical protein SH850_30230 [Planctomycetaceae bacterium]|nr:hypothetical protein [Planctomycetaceae bacterium]
MPGRDKSSSAARRSSPRSCLPTVGGHFPGYGFSPDGRLLAYSRTPNEVCLEDVETGRQVALFEATDDCEVGTPQFSRDGSQLIVGSGYPPTVRVWNLAALRAHLNEIGLADDLPEWPAPQTVPPQKPIRFDLGLSAKQLAAQAGKHRTNRQYAEACACLEQCLARDPNQPVNLNRLAWLRAIGPASVRNVIDAEQLSSKAVELDPQGSYQLNTLGLVQHRLGRDAEAAATLQRAADLGRERKQSLQPSVNGFPRAMVLHRLGRIEEARTAYDEAATWLAANREIGYLHEHDALQTEAAWVLGIRDP